MRTMGRVSLGQLGRKEERASLVFGGPRCFVVVVIPGTFFGGPRYFSSGPRYTATLQEWVTIFIEIALGISDTWLIAFLG